MEKAYKLNKKRMITYFLVFLLVCSAITYMTVGNTLKYKAVLDDYDDSVKTSFTTIDVDKMVEKMNYDRDHGRYSLRLLMTIVICSIELIVLYLYFLRIGSLVIDEEGIKVHSLFGKKPRHVYHWHEIKSVKFHHGYGMRGLISEYGMDISNAEGEKFKEEIFVPIERLLDYDQIPGLVKENGADIKMEDLRGIKKEERSILELFHDAYIQYKSNFGSFMAYSMIIFIFAFMDALFKNALLGFVISIASIYFGYRAKIAMNYKAFMSYRGEEIGFERGWQFPKGRIGRYFGANLVIGFIGMIFWGLVFFCLISDMGVYIKILLSVIFAIGGFIIICRLYLITYIASIVDTHVSYMSLNGVLGRKYHREVAVLVGLTSLSFIPMIAITAMYYTDSYTMQMLLSRMAYINLVISLFVTPYVSCYVMRLLKDLPESGERNHIEEGMDINQV